MNTLPFYTRLPELQKQYGTEVQFVNLLPGGNIDTGHLESLLKEPTPTLVSLMMVNNEIGNILPMETVADLCKKYKAYFHSDCVQSVGHMQVDLKKIQVDFINASAHKFHGPKGIGFAYIKKGNPIGPMITGGEQERGIRAGTENVSFSSGHGKSPEHSHSQFGNRPETPSVIKGLFYGTAYKKLARDYL